MLPTSRTAVSAAIASFAVMDCVVSAPVAYAQSKATEFSELGTTVKSASLKTPAGADTIRQLSAPLDDNGNNVLLNFYKLNGVVFVDVLTSKNNQPWTQRNHIRLQAPLPLRPDKMTVTMRYLSPVRRTGYMIIAADDGGNLTLTFPKGFGGTVSQQAFLANSSTDIRRTYTFGDQDSHGFTMVKSTVESSGQVKPSDDVQYFVWNGSRFIPRRPN